MFDGHRDRLGLGNRIWEMTGVPFIGNDKSLGSPVLALHPCCHN